MQRHVVAGAEAAEVAVAEVWPIVGGASSSTILPVPMLAVVKVTPLRSPFPPWIVAVAAGTRILETRSRCYVRCGIA